MFTPEDLTIKNVREEDIAEISRMIKYVQNDEEQAEFRRQVKSMLRHPGLWVVTGVLIFVLGITQE